MSLNAQNLSFEAGDRLLFQNLELRLLPGDVLQICGPNGVGKTSLLRILAGISSSLSGAIERVDNCLYIGHKPGLWLQLTVAENLYHMHGLPEDLHADILKQINLLGFGDAKACELSSGQLRRLALAKLLTEFTPIWFLDEPLTALDTQGVTWVTHLIDTHCQNAGSVVFTSHHDLTLKTPIKKLKVHDYAPAY